MIKAPFTTVQVDALNKYQHSDNVHPYTCPNAPCRKTKTQGIMIATPDGWICQTCDYTQNWANELTPEKSDIEKERDCYRSALRNVIDLRKSYNVINPDWYKIATLMYERCERALEDGKQYIPKQPMSESLLKKLASIHGIDLEKCKGENIDVITGKPIFPGE